MTRAWQGRRQANGFLEIQGEKLTNTGDRGYDRGGIKGIGRQILRRKDGEDLTFLVCPRTTLARKTARSGDRASWKSGATRPPSLTEYLTSTQLMLFPEE